MLRQRCCKSTKCRCEYSHCELLSQSSVKIDEYQLTADDTMDNIFSDVESSSMSSLDTQLSSVDDSDAQSRYCNIPEKACRFTEAFDGGASFTSSADVDCDFMDSSGSELSSMDTLDAGSGYMSPSDRQSEPMTISDGESNSMNLSDTEFIHNFFSDPKLNSTHHFETLSNSMDSSDSESCLGTKIITQKIGIAEESARRSDESEDNYTDSSISFESNEEFSISNVDHDDSVLESTRSADNDKRHHDTSTEDDPDSKPLYPDAPLSARESKIMTLSFAMRHNLTDSCLEDLLLLLDGHFPKPNNCTTSLYKLRKWSKKFETSYERHYYCSECSTELKKPDDRCTNCLTPKLPSYFIHIPLISQLKQLFKRPGFYNKLSYRFDRKKRRPEDLEDMFDGNVYQELSRENDLIDLTDQSNVSFTWNSDGISVYNSSKFSIWGLLLKFNELSPAERNKTSNMLFGGISFGPKKPFANLFLKIFVDTFRELYNGVMIYVEDLGREIKIRGIIVCGSLDLPAKAIFLHMKQYNGRFGCHICKIETVKIRGSRAYQKIDGFDLRTSEETLEFAREAIRKKTSIFGVKGPTVLSKIVPDFIRNTVIDPMHLLSGVIKSTLGIWIDPQHHDHPASLSKFAHIIDERISSVTPPSFVERLPRTTADYHYWKASELITWLLTYSTIILSDIMHQEYFSHHLLLVLAIYLLSQKSITPQDIDNAIYLLYKYVSKCEKLYGLKFLTCNIHSLLHLGKIVKDYGPLQVFSCFPFENVNGIIKRLIHATRDPQIQVSRGISQYLMLESLKKELPPQSNALLFCERLESKSTLRQKLYRVNTHSSIAGRPKKLNLVPPELEGVLVQAGLFPESVYEFHRLKHNSMMFSSTSYSRTTKTDSTCITYTVGTENCIGIIEIFIRISNCDCSDGLCQNCMKSAKTFAIIRKCDKKVIFNTSDPALPLDFINLINIKPNEPCCLVDISRLETVLYRISIERTGLIYAIKSVPSF